jgi:hypothetical protein
MSFMLVKDEILRVAVAVVFRIPVFTGMTNPVLSGTISTAC